MYYLHEFQNLIFYQWLTKVVLLTSIIQSFYYINMGINMGVDHKLLVQLFLFGFRLSCSVIGKR